MPPTTTFPNLSVVGLTDAGHSDLLESQVEPPIAARAAAQSATIAFLNAQARGDASALDTTLGQLAADGHLVFVNAMPVPLLGDPAAWLLACLLVAGGASYLGLRRALAG